MRTKSLPTINKKLVPLTHDGRENGLDLLRLIFALIVLLSHSYPLFRGGDGGEPFLMLTSGQITAGSLAVDGFFTISGFLIAASWERSRGFADYLWRRLLRIYPGFIVACIFSALVAGPLGASSIRGYRSQFWRGGFMRGVLTLEGPVLPPTFLGNPFTEVVNGSLWTIRYEFILYLLVGFLGIAGLFRKLFMLNLFLFSYSSVLIYDFGFGAYRYISHGVSFDSPIHLLGHPSAWSRFLTFFLAGSLAYLWRLMIPRSRKLATISVMVLIIACWIPPIFVALLPICGSYLLFWVAFAPRLAATRHYADLSYGIYLYAFPIQQMIVSMSPGIGPFILTAAATPVTLALATMSWFLVESPALRLKVMSIKTPLVS